MKAAPSPSGETAAVVYCPKTIATAGDAADSSAAAVPEFVATLSPEGLVQIRGRVDHRQIFRFEGGVILVNGGQFSIVALFVAAHTAVAKIDFVPYLEAGHPAADRFDHAGPIAAKDQG